VGEFVESGNGEGSGFVSLFRISETNPPTLWDFLSYKARGAPLRYQTAKGLRLWDGLSVYQTRELAIQVATVSPRIGKFVVELRIRTDGPFRSEFDNGDNGHCTIWGEAAALLKLVVSVTHV
jgi:hypothetical protein